MIDLRTQIHNTTVAKTLGIITLLGGLILLTTCASINMPQGGQKDIKAPKVISTNPQQTSVNFKGKRITLTFDEELDITKLKDRIIISPYYKGEYDLDKTPKKLIINLLDTLIKGETYTINFQDGLKDIHEGVNIKQYKLSFSTGPKIDSLRVYGCVEDAYTKKKLPNYLVGLYVAKDTANPEIKKPKYLAYTDQYGTFTFTNIKPAQYEIFAFNDINKNQLLNIKSEYIAYQQSSINPTHLPDSITIESTRNDLYKPVFLTGKNDTEYKLIFNKGLYKYQITSSEPLLHDLSDNKKEINIYKTNLCEDSLEIKVHAVDTSYNDTSFTTKIVRSAPKKFKTFKNNLSKVSPDPSYIVSDSLPLILTFSYPIVRDKDSAIVITNDSISFKYLRLLRDFTPNTSNTIFTYTYKRKPKKYLGLHIKKNSFFTSVADTNESFEAIYKTNTPTTTPDEESTYATINLKTNETNYFIILVNDKNETVNTQKNQTKITYKNLKPGKYSIKIIADDNNDNKWDTGNYRKKIMPERVVLYKDYLDIRANWDIEDVDILF